MSVYKIDSKTMHSIDFLARSCCILRLLDQIILSLNIILTSFQDISFSNIYFGIDCFENNDLLEISKTQFFVKQADVKTQYLYSITILSAFKAFKKSSV